LFHLLPFSFFFFPSNSQIFDRGFGYASYPPFLTFPFLLGVKGEVKGAMTDDNGYALPLLLSFGSLGESARLGTTGPFFLPLLYLPPFFFFFPPSNSMRGDEVTKCVVELRFFSLPPPPLKGRYPDMGVGQFPFLSFPFPQNVGNLKDSSYSFPFLRRSLPRQHHENRASSLFLPSLL